MYRIRYTAAPKSNLLKVLISIVSLSASITAPSPFNSDSGAREHRRASRNSYCSFLEHRAIEIERRNDCSSFNRASCCNLLENQARRFDRGRMNGRSACGAGSFFSDLCNGIRRRF